MVTAKTLISYGFHYKDNINEFFYNGWDYMFIVNTQELYDSNDGYGEPTLLTKIYNLQHLMDVMFAYDGTELILKDE